MSWIKIGLLVLLVVVIVIQFIQPARNKNEQVLATDITRIYTLPENIKAILKTSCYDCHSNNTDYPWYANIQPGGWWLASHIKDGKAELNFSEFGTYSNRRQQSKLKSIANSIEDGAMPLASYTLIHRNVKLSEEDKTLLMNWVIKTKDSLKLKIKQ